METPLIFVLYDSVTNSVFDSQIHNLLQKKARENPDQKIYLISFETNNNKDLLKNKDCLYTTTYFKKYFFLGSISIWHGSYLLRKFLHSFKRYSIIARGSIAGLIAYNAYNKNNCSSFILQVRGLLADEHTFTHQDNCSYLMKSIHYLRAKQLHCIEKKSYALTKRSQVIIEAVSSALKKHLIDTYTISKERITIAQSDLPKTIPVAQKALWRKEVRDYYNIPDSCLVYCYNGSVKPWQKPELVIQYFKKALKKNERSFLLIITQDIFAFTTLLKKNCAPDFYHVIKVPHEDIYKYLSAADYGLLLRDPHIVNWTSRPTKALEYQAVGLKIIHNSTIAYLNK